VRLPAAPPAKPLAVAGGNAGKLRVAKGKGQGGSAGGCAAAVVAATDILRSLSFLLAAGQIRRTWQAHLSPTKALAAVGPLVYSLGGDGSIRGWSSVAPSAAHLTAWHVRS
jgi:hypothetical protein